MVRVSLLVYAIHHSDMEQIHQMNRISMYVYIHGIKLPNKVYDFIIACVRYLGLGHETGYLCWST